MASFQTIAKAKAFGIALHKVIGEEPSYQYFDEHVRIYYPQNKLKKVREKLKEISSREPGEIQFDWFPLITPLAVERGLPVIGAILLLGYLLGAGTKK